MRLQRAGGEGWGSGASWTCEFSGDGSLLEEWAVAAVMVVVVVMSWRGGAGGGRGTGTQGEGEGAAMVSNNVAKGEQLDVLDVKRR